MTPFIHFFSLNSVHTLSPPPPPVFVIYYTKKSSKFQFLNIFNFPNCFFNCFYNGFSAGILYLTCILTLPSFFLADYPFHCPIQKTDFNVFPFLIFYYGPISIFTASFSITTLILSFLILPLLKKILLILLSTLSSLDITGIPLRWFESYLTGRSFKVAWGGEVSKAHQLVTGVPQGSVLGPLLFSTYTTSLGPIIQAYGFSYHFYADDTQLYLSFRPDDPTVAARISGCLADISAWMKEHHLQLNLAKTELLVLPATPTLQHDFTIQLGSSITTSSASVRNLGVIFDDQLTFKKHITKTARSCRFALHNIRKIRPFLTEHATQILVQALVISRLDYCNALLAGLPSNTIKPLQRIQNAAARLVFNEPKRAHVTPLFVSLHWLPVAACIQFKTLMRAYRTTTGSAPSYFHSLLQIYIPSRSLRSASERHLVVPSQRGSKSLSRTFSFTIPGW